MGPLLMVALTAAASPLQEYAAWSAVYHGARQSAPVLGSPPAPRSEPSPPRLLGEAIGGEAQPTTVHHVGRATVQPPLRPGGPNALSFDMNGVRVEGTVTGATGLSAVMSQVQKVEGNVFQVFLDGVLQPGSRFNTSGWVAGQHTTVPLFPSGSLDAAATYTVAVVKDTEPQFAGTRVAPNYVTFWGFAADDATAVLLPPPPPPPGPPPHRLEFLGDSITAGFDNQCDVPGAPRGFPWSESFMKSWATGICESLDGECHYTAWSGFGMVANCCGGSTLASDVWSRTLATVGSANASDPHGTTPANEWDFSLWTPEAVVINLGTNDHLGPNPTPKSAAYTQRYTALVTAAAKAYGNATRFFLACGPMASDYCSEVLSVINTVNAAGIRAHFLDQRGFESGAYGKDCAYGHPGSQDDAAMAQNGSAVIKAAMGW